MNRADFQKVSTLRVSEAKVLIDNGYFAGAYYLLGYSIECALKACISKQVKQYDFPDKKLIIESYTHNLETLLNLSGYKNELYNGFKLDPVLEQNWATVKDWKEDSRYNVTITEKDARDLYSAVTQRKSGVLTWLIKRW
jgi:hypothetical protein